MARDAISMLLGAVLGFLGFLLVWIAHPSPPPVQEQDVRIVRMLDVTIKDSNTTNRRQRFICSPAEGK